jgi:hypothetical protein
MSPAKMASSRRRPATIAPKLEASVELLDETGDHLCQFFRIRFGDLCVRVDVVGLEILFQLVYTGDEICFRLLKLFGFQAGINIGQVPSGQFLGFSHSLLSWV